MIVDDYIQPAVLTGFVREVPPSPMLTLNRWLPDTRLEDIEAAIEEVTKTNRVAEYRSWDTETPIQQRDSWKRSKVKIPPVGNKLPIMEEERLKMERVRTRGDNFSGYVTAIYDDATNLSEYVHNRLELARGDVLTDGKFTLTGENGLTIEADFGLPADNQVSASTVWSDAANASPLTDLKAWVDEYVDINGFRPEFMQTSNTVVNNMVLSQEIRELFASMVGSPSLVTQSQLNQVLQAHNLPQIVEYNTRLDVNGVDTRVIPQDKVLLLPPTGMPLGITAWGITAEALELASGQNPSLEFEQLPGLIGVVLKEGDPVRTWTKVGATAMPILSAPRRLMVADVLA